jgi:hypothetical protein
MKKWTADKAAVWQGKRGTNLNNVVGNNVKKLEANSAPNLKSTCVSTSTESKAPEHFSIMVGLLILFYS